MNLLPFSLPLFWHSLAFLGGILLAAEGHLSLRGWGLLFFGLSALYGLLRLALARLSLPHPLNGPAAQGMPPVPAARFAALLPLLITFTIGALRYELALPRIDAHHIAWYLNREYDLILTARLVEPPSRRDTYTALRLAVESVDTGDEILPVHGQILARLSGVAGAADYAYGDLLRLRGRVQSPPSGELFSYQEYLARQGIHAYMPQAEVTWLASGGNPLLRLTYAFRQGSLRLLYRLYPDPEASLLAGILLGEEGGIPRQTQEAFKITGTSHIIAISGFNIAIIVALFSSFFGRLLGARRGAAVAVAGVIFYTVLVGAAPSVVRAAIMGTLSILATQLARRQIGLNTLAFTAAVMALLSPFTLWDVGFQLSFAATLGLILYGAPLQEWAARGLTHLRLPKALVTSAVQFLSDAVLLTLAAQITSLPVMAYHFQQISLIAFLANPFILPLQPAVMILGGLSLLLAWISYPLGQVLAWLAWPFPAYTIRVVEGFARIPGSVLTFGRVPLSAIVLYYAALLSWTFGREARQKAAQALQRWLPLSLSVVTGLLLALALLLWRAVFALPDGRLHLTFLSVGSADAILIRAPGGGWVLVNGGPSAIGLSDALGRRLSPFEHHLDWLVVASTQQEQLASLPYVLERYPPRQVLWAGLPQASAAARALDGWLTEHAIPVTYAESGQVLDLGHGARLEVVAQGRRGAVLLLEWGEFRALLPIGLDLDLLPEMRAQARLRNLTLFSLPESGYPPLLSEEWLAELAPQVVILSVAAADPDGNPTPEVLKLLKPYSLLRTDQAGWIEVVTDGKQMRLLTEKPLTLPPPPAAGKGEDLYPLER